MLLAVEDLSGSPLDDQADDYRDLSVCKACGC